MCISRPASVNGLTGMTYFLKSMSPVAIFSEPIIGETSTRYLCPRIGLAALLGAGVVERIFKASGNPAAKLWDIAGWGLLAVSLIGFFFYLVKVGRTSRRMQTAMEGAEQGSVRTG